MTVNPEQTNMDCMLPHTRMGILVQSLSPRKIAVNFITREFYYMTSTFEYIFKGFTFANKGGNKPVPTWRRVVVW